MSATTQLATQADRTTATGSRRRALWLLAAGVVIFAAAVGASIYGLSHLAGGWDPVDLNVYRAGGLVVRQLAPFGHPRGGAALYSWPKGRLQFTYTPFAALLFTVLTLPPVAALHVMFAAVNIAAVAVAVWVTLGGLGYRRGTTTLGVALLAAGILLWTEPAQRTLFLGQIELVLMALIMWDMCQPDDRRWKGAGVGIAAGIKLVPLLFIPYLLLTRRFRQAAVAAGAFAATVLLGFAVLPGDSVRWWLDGLFTQGGRTGFIGWEGNQSLPGLITRLAGSVAAAGPIWLAVSVVTAGAGLTCAMVLDRAGYRLPGLLTVALTALLISPISWDHHWVWAIPAVVVAGHYAVRTGTRRGWTLAGLAAVVALIFGAWPGSLWGAPLDLGAFSEGLIWAPPNTNPGLYAQIGDRRRFAEYHWHGIQLLVGNLYVLTGAAIFAGLLGLAVIAIRRSAIGAASRD